jgi:hypothetical protein
VIDDDDEPIDFEKERIDYAALRRQQDVLHRASVEPWTQQCAAEIVDSLFSSKL